jgi:hypothetical protein
MDVGVPDYWVVDLDARVVEWWSPERQSPIVLRSILEWRPAGARAPLVTDLPALFERISSKSRRLSGSPRTE